jgi:hypothetical protein
MRCVPILIDARRFFASADGRVKLAQQLIASNRTLIQRNERARSIGDYRHEQETQG